MQTIKLTSQGDLACSWCGYRIPTKGKKHVLQDWISAEVQGMFCSESHAKAAGNNVSYVEKFSHKFAESR